ncbi:MAG: FHA domain-containing protein, partial [Thermosynechococcaceae cyanobacterium]
SMWMSRSSSSLPAGYYCSLVGKKFWTIGSGKDCTIVFNDPLVSSQHAILLASASREIYFCDLQSVNGSFLNDDPIIRPVLLHHGDRLKIGPFEIEFQNSGDISVPQSAEVKRLVLLVQASVIQGDIWAAILKACGVSVIYKNPIDPYLQESFEPLLENLEEFPDLLLVDVETLRPNPYEFCRWCREQYPSLKIILTCSTRTEIFVSEKRWATQQGALDLLPAFIPDRLLVGLSEVAVYVNCVLRALGAQELQRKPLESTVRSLLGQFRQRRETRHKISLAKDLGTVKPLTSEGPQGPEPSASADGSTQP